MANDYGGQLAPGAIRGVNQATEGRQIVWKGGRELPIIPEHLAGLIERERNQATRNHRPDRMEVVLQAGDDTEIASTAPERPEQVLVFTGARPHYFSGRGDDLSRA